MDHRQMDHRHPVCAAGGHPACLGFARGFRCSTHPAGWKPVFHSSPHPRLRMNSLMSGLYVFALSAFLGYLVISRVPPLLHTPLMSATNAISGISLVGSLVTAGGNHSTLSTVLGVTAVICATINVVGGFWITERMLRFFRRKETPAAKEKNSGTAD